jgi:hypothetical protein
MLKLNRYKTNSRVPVTKHSSLTGRASSSFVSINNETDFIYLYLAELGFVCLFVCLFVANPVTPAEERSSYRVNLCNYVT